MIQTSAPTTTRIFLIAGLALLVTALLLSSQLVTALASLFGVLLRLEGMESLVRIWVLKIVCVAAGLPLLLYKYRSHPKGKPFFDASVGVVFVVVLLMSIEGLFYMLNNSNKPSSSGPETSTTFSAPYVEPDGNLGYTLKSNVQVTATQKTGDQIIYNIVYTTDKQHRRVTPVDAPESRDKFILFFGCSFTFGDGLANDETLPAFVGRAAPEYMPYNYGISGYGPQQVLAKWQSSDISTEINQAQGLAIYTFICPHVGRAIGSMEVTNTWGSVMPYYFLDSNDQLVRKGDFVTGRPALSTIYAGLGVSQTAQYFNLTVPRLNDNHYRFTARIIKEAAREFEQTFNQKSFYVLFFPGTEACAAPLIPYLDQLGVNYLNYATLRDRGAEDFWQPDGHPTAATQKMVAEKLVGELELAEPH